MNLPLFHAAFLNKALYLPHDAVSSELTEESAALLVVLNRVNYGVDEDCLHHLNALGKEELEQISDLVPKLFYTDKNWAALTKEWNTRPTGVSFINFFITAIENHFPGLQREGTTLPCGHFIPVGVFDLSRYTGCPFCGTSFVEAKANLTVNDPSTLKILRRWSNADAEALARQLVGTSTPLDAMKTKLLNYFLEGLPADFFLAIDDIPCVENRAFVAGYFFNRDDQRFVRFLKTPTDMLRTLWGVKTKSMPIIRPAVFKKWVADGEADLHYSRATGRVVAKWFENLDMSPEQICVAMHPYREMWVRFIRALRLNDQARRYHLPRLTEVLDRFYNKDYSVWAGEVATARLNGDIDRLLGLLKERPGAFARALFDTVLDFDPRAVFDAFISVADKLPVRLLISLYNAVPAYFLPQGGERTIVLPDNRTVTTAVNPGILRLSAEERRDMASELMTMLRQALLSVYARRKPLPSPACVAAELFDCPVPVGDRGTAVSAVNFAVPGQRFPVKGDKVRLFIHWGRDMPAQHYDMDLSCRLVGPLKQKDIAFYSLDEEGAVHSGDIQFIPDTVGAAEYIELDMPVLVRDGYRNAIFTVNAYSQPNLATDILFGWMSSENEMTVDDETGVAYNPADVDMILGIGGMTHKRGLVFGVLDMENHTITYLEITNDNQRLDQLDMGAVEAMMQRLADKITIGELISLRAAAHNKVLNTTLEGATAYTLDNWLDADVL